MATKVMHADKMEIFNKNSAKLGEGTSFHCHHGDQQMEITDWKTGSYVSLKHVLPLVYVCVRQQSLSKMVTNVLLKQGFLR